MTDQDDLTKRLEACYTSAVHDVMYARGFKDFVLPPEIRPLAPARTVAGPAFTLRGRWAPGTDAHETLLAWTGMLSRAPAGHVMVCQANDTTVAHMGELSAGALQARGVRGYVVDGGCRDVALIERIGFPVWCRYFTPRDVVGTWLPEGFDEPVRIGEATVAPGDYVLADRDGIVVVPADHAADIVAETETTVTTEDKVRETILAGVDPQEAFLKHGKF